MHFGRILNVLEHFLVGIPDEENTGFSKIRSFSLKTFLKGILSDIQ